MFGMGRKAKAPEEEVDGELAGAFTEGVPLTTEDPFKKGKELYTDCDGLRATVGHGKNIVTDMMLRYLLRCHKNDPAKAAHACELYHDFRQKHMDACEIEGTVIPEDIIKVEGATQKMGWCTVKGKDDGPYITFAVLIMRRHLTKSTSNIHEKCLHFMSILEQVIDRIELTDGQLHVLFDMGRMGLKNADFKFIKELSNLQKVDRDLMTKIYFANLSTFFHGCWKVCQPWFSPRIVNKIAFVKSKDLPGELEHLVQDMEHLPNVVKNLYVDAKHFKHVRNSIGGDMCNGEVSGYEEDGGSSDADELALKAAKEQLDGALGPAPDALADDIADLQVDDSATAPSQ